MSTEGNEESDQLVWNEQDWRQYLREADRELVQFLTFYQKFRLHPDRLDEVAEALGWKREDWFLLKAGEDSPEIASLLEKFSEDDLFSVEPYAIDRHPVLLATRAFYALLARLWEYVLGLSSCARVDSWQYGESLHKGERHALLGVSAMDMGECALAICHFKRALNALNESMRLLQKIPEGGGILAFCVKESQRVFFDLREVWLRSMSLCMTEEEVEDD